MRLLFDLKKKRINLNKLFITGILITIMLSGCIGSNEKTQSLNEIPDFQVINMSVDEKGWTPNAFILQKGVKVEWIINVKNLTKCNNEIIVKDYGLDIKLKNGENKVEFMPEKDGKVNWSCWMNMIPGVFIVVNETANISNMSDMINMAMIDMKNVSNMSDMNNMSKMTDKVDMNISMVNNT